MRYNKRRKRVKDINLDISYQNNDIILKLMAQEFKDKSLKFYGINVPNIFAADGKQKKQ